MTMLEVARTSTRLALRADGASDPGRLRNKNEDRLHLDVERGIFVVADGVGGHLAGEVAATIAIDVVVQRLERPVGTPAQRVREAIACANNAIVNDAQTSPARAGMTCVLTVALVADEGVTIGHVGDTRLYEITASGIWKVTHDHSPIGEREDAGEISEADAMRHPRRNEVFRDVGSALHEPDDPDFIEIIEMPFPGDSALLLCSDGLSDMLDTSAIETIVRRHGGNPPRVVHELLEAANRAGGRDNITAVYVEHEGFTPGPVRRDSAHTRQHGKAGSSRWIRFLRHAILLLVGTTAGLALGVVPAVRSAIDRVAGTPGGRTLVVGGTSATRYSTIANAMAAAAPRDVIELEPGEYAESIVLKDGVDLVARVPGTVVFVAPPGRPDWTSVSASGGSGNRVAGLRIVGRSDAPIGVGMRLAGHELQVDDISIEGRVGIGMDIVDGAGIVVRASRLSDVDGVPMRVHSGARPVLRQNLFVRGSSSTSAALELDADAAPQLMGNLFVGYADPVRGASGSIDQLVKGNYAIRPQDPPVSRRGPGGAGQRSPAERGVSRRSQDEGGRTP